MANVLYPKFKQDRLEGGVSLLTADIKVVLIDLADYTFAVGHQFLSDIPAGARVATSPNLGTKVTTDGIFDAANTTFTAVTGDESEALGIYIDSGVAATSALIAFLDTGITGMPVTPNGGDINVNWDEGASKIFAL